MFKLFSLNTPPMSLFETTAAAATKAVPLPKVRMVSSPLTGGESQPVPELQVLVPVVEVLTCVAACNSGLAATVSNNAKVAKNEWVNLRLAAILLKKPPAALT